MTWKQIWDTKYSVSDRGLVINNITGKLVSQRPGGTSEYLLVTLRINRKAKNYLVHRLVAEMFIPNTHNKCQVNHINGVKTDNTLANLEWCTGRENMLHAVQRGLYKKFNNQVYKGRFGKDHNRSIKIMCGGIIYYGISEASRLTSIPISTISYCLKNGNTLRNGMKFIKAQ